MNKQKIYYYLNKAGICEGSDNSRADYILLNCPFARWTHKRGTDRHPSFMIHSGVKTSTYSCYSCGEYGELWKLFYSLGGLTGKQDLIKIGYEIYDEDKGEFSKRIQTSADMYRLMEEREIDMRPLERHIMSFSDNFPENAKMYLKKRQLELSVISQFKLKYDKWENRIVLPVYNSERFIGAVGRTVINDEKRYKNYWGSNLSIGLGKAGLFNEECERILVVEGMFDLFRTYQNIPENYEVVNIFKSRISPKQADMLEGYGKPLVIYLDNDDAGRKGERHAQNMMKGKVPKIYSIFTENDPGDTSKEELINKLKSI